MDYLVLLRVGVPKETPVDFVWKTVTENPGMKRTYQTRLYKPQRGIFEPTEWVFAFEVRHQFEQFELPSEQLAWRKHDQYPLRKDYSPLKKDLLSSGLPIQLVTITVVEPYVDRFEAWYGPHSEQLSRVPGAVGVRRYWTDEVPRRYASLYYYDGDAGYERYFNSEGRARAAQSREPFDPWLVDQTHTYYRDVTPSR